MAQTKQESGQGLEYMIQGQSSKQSGRPNLKQRIIATVTGLLLSVGVALTGGCAVAPRYNKQPRITNKYDHFRADLLEEQRYQLTHPETTEMPHCYVNGFDIYAVAGDTFYRSDYHFPFDSIERYGCIDTYGLRRWGKYRVELPVEDQENISYVLMYIVKRRGAYKPQFFCKRHDANQYSLKSNHPDVKLILLDTYEKNLRGLGILDTVGIATFNEYNNTIWSSMRDEYFYDVDEMFPMGQHQQIYESVIDAFTDDADARITERHKEEQWRHDAALKKEDQEQKQREEEQRRYRQWVKERTDDVHKAIVIGAGSEEKH